MPRGEVLGGGGATCSVALCLRDPSLDVVGMRFFGM